MAEETDRDARTEAPTPRRLEQAFNEGQVPIGRDAVTWVALACGGGALVFLGPRLLSELVLRVGRAVARADQTPFADLPGLLLPLALLGVSLVLAPAAGALVATLVQTRANVWGDQVAPDPERLTRGARSLNLFRKEQLLELALQLGKLLAVGAVAYGVLGPELLSLPQRLSAPKDQALANAFSPLFRLAVRAGAVLGALAVLDLIKTRWQFTNKLKMTKDEVRRELKEDEGDPLLRSRRRRRHRELAKGRAEVEVPRADALVVNPTHVAVALRYRKDEGGAPRVLAKGKGKLAERMRELARQNGVPIVEDIPLARLLYRKVKVGRAVPAETYRAVAAVLAFVYRVTGRARQGAES